MKKIPKGLGVKGYWQAFLLIYRLGREFGFPTVWRKIRFQTCSLGNRRYARWWREYEPAAEALQKERMAAEKLPYRPRISVIMPVYNPAPLVLEQAVVSVLQQTYGHWELCIADGSDGERRFEIRELLRNYADRDPRIRVRVLNHNRGISGNTNEALDMAKGEFLALLDHDDTLAPSALFRMAERLNRDPDLDLLYSDRDLLSEDGKKRFHPFFKPEWSPELLLSVNYLIHLALFRKALLEKSGPMNPETDGAQDWDLFFRIAEITNRIAHVPGILYHWRVGPSSAAWSRTAKPYLVQAQIRAVQDHCRRVGMEAEASFGRGGAIRIRWQPRTWEKVSLILLPRSARKNHRRWIQRLREKTRYPDYEIHCLESQQSEVLSKVTVHKGVVKDGLGENLWFKNTVQAAQGTLLVFLDDSVEILDPDWLAELSGWTGRKDIAAVGSFLPTPDYGLDPTGVPGASNLTLPPGVPFSWVHQGVLGSPVWYRNPFSLSWSCLAVRKDILMKFYDGGIDFFSPSRSPSNFWMKIQQAGYRNLYTPFAGVKKRD